MLCKDTCVSTVLCVYVLCCVCVAMVRGCSGVARVVCCGKCSDVMTVVCGCGVVMCFGGDM